MYVYTIICDQKIASYRDLQKNKLIFFSTNEFNIEQLTSAGNQGRKQKGSEFNMGHRHANKMTNDMQGIMKVRSQCGAKGHLKRLKTRKNS